jgi:hypothetical protein
VPLWHRLAFLPTDQKGQERHITPLQCSDPCLENLWQFPFLGKLIFVHLINVIGPFALCFDIYDCTKFGEKLKVNGGIMHTGTYCELGK